MIHKSRKIKTIYVYFSLLLDVNWINTGYKEAFTFELYYIIRNIFE